ncbi:MAG: hypothetical protein JWL70_2259, partial [Acidimicrobiia bacterium]|nr:hypothetical protein [Acidimicrobiia bacterium]
LRGAVSALTTEEIQEVNDYNPPAGVFLAAWAHGVVVGCGALRRLDESVGEIKRMWIDPNWRGQGNGVRLMTALEDHARRLRFRLLRLDTSAQLIEAVRLYEGRGYQRIERYNDNLDADSFYEKALSA